MALTDTKNDNPLKFQGWFEDYMFSGHGQNFVHAFLDVCRHFYSENECTIMFMDFRDSQNHITIGNPIWTGAA